MTNHQHNLRPLAALLALLVAALGVRAEEAPPRLKGGESSEKPLTGPPAPKPLPLPADAVWVVIKDIGDAFRLDPTGVFLSRAKYDRYQRLEKELADLKARLQKTALPSPTSCHLKGKVEGNLVLLQARFDFKTDKPHAVLFVACNPGLASGAALDGGTAPLEPGTDGFRVQADKPGSHQLTLDLVLGLAGRGNGRGFALDLPRAATTSLDLVLPAGVKDVQIGGRPPADSLAAVKGGHLQAAALGPLDKLEVSWRGAHGTPDAAPALTAEGKLEVELDTHGLTTRAELTLKALGAPAKQWRLLVPLKADLRVTGDDGRLARVEMRDHKHASERILHLKEPSLAPLKVTVITHAAVPRTGTVTPVGPFTVLGAAALKAKVRVRNRLPNLRLDFRAHGALTRQALAEGEQRDPELVAAFTYWNTSLPNQPPRGGAAPSWLDLEAEAVRGQVQTQVRHELTLLPKGDGARGWPLLTTIVVTPRWADVDHVNVPLPTGCAYVEDSATAAPADKLRGASYEAAGRVVRFELKRFSASPKSFTLTLRSTLTPPDGRDRAVLPLPVPRGTVDQGGEVTVRVPPRVELTVLEGANPDLELVRQTAHEQTWKSPWRAPARVEVAWRPYRPWLRAESVVDVTLGEREGRVLHELRLNFAQAGAPSLTLRVPRGLKGGLSVVEGGALAAGAAGTDTRVLTLTPPARARHTVVLAYDFPMEGKGGGPLPPGTPFAVPLVQVQEATEVQTRVRVWSERPELLPVASGNAWSRLPLEDVRGKSSFPALVLGSRGGGPPLMLRLGEQPPQHTVLVHWARVQVAVGDNGGQRFRARFLLSRLVGRHLDVELPAPVATLGLRAALGGKQVHHAVVEEAGRQAEGGRVARLRLGPELVGGRALLVLEYEVPPGRADGGVVRTTLTPPLLRGAPERVPTVWQVTAPPGWVTVAPGDEPALRRTWVRRGWLLAPALAVTPADLDRLFAGDEATDTTAEGDSFPSPTLVCRQDGPGPLTLTHAPRQAWLLVCSLGLLVVGLGLLWLLRPAVAGGPVAAWLWPVLAVLALSAAVAALFWPSLMAAVAYGCEPGAAVLLVVAAVQWLLHQRYRRQIIFLPSFSRSRGSSLLRGSSGGPRPHGEPSTVDAPQPVGSSAKLDAPPRPDGVDHSGM